MSQLGLQLAQRLFCLLACGDVHDRPNVLDASSVISCAMCQNVDPLDGAIGHEQSMLEVYASHVEGRATEDILHEGNILRMSSLKNQRERRRRFAITFHD